jgi:hypothetical protein
VCKFDIPVIALAKKLAKKYTADLHTSSTLDCLNKNSMTHAMTQMRRRWIEREEIAN